MKKVFISLDTEGLSGVTSWKEMENSPNPAVEAYVRELRWIIDELFKKEPGLEEITLCDSHSRGENLPYGVFDDPRVTMVSGYPRQNYMLATLDGSYDMLMLVGYHGMIGSKDALMDHSYSSSAIYNIRINGEAVGETELNAYYAAQFGVPLGFVDGDSVLEEELKHTSLKPEFVKTKEGLGRFSAKLYSPSCLEPKFRAAVDRAVDRCNRKELPVVKAASPTTLSIDLMTTVMADALEILPIIKRTGGRTIEYASSSFTDVMDVILFTALMGGRYANFR